MPRTVGSRRRPGKQYESQSRRGRFADLVIHLGCQIEAHTQPKIAKKCTAFLRLHTLSSPTQFREDPLFSGDRKISNRPFVFIPHGGFQEPLAVFCAQPPKLHGRTNSELVAP
jgi:hypothetical protein